jgi:hypothetical protein
MGVGGVGMSLGAGPAALAAPPAAAPSSGGSGPRLGEGPESAASVVAFQPSENSGRSAADDLTALALLALLSSHRTDTHPSALGLAITQLAMQAYTSIQSGAGLQGVGQLSGGFSAKA